MAQSAPAHPAVPSPHRLLLTVAVIFFLAEAAVMLILPDRHSVAEAFLDAAMLILLGAPFLWWFVGRPLRSAAVAEQVRAATIVRHAGDGIITMNPQGLVESFNPAAERLFGYRADEVVGQPLSRLMPDRYRAAHERGLERLRSTPRALPVGRVVEVEGLRSDGREFPLELSLATWPTPTGLSYLGIVRDITERRQAEAQLQLQGAALKATANAILITDREGRIAWVNPAFSQLTGYTPEEAIGQTPRLLNSGRHDRAFYRNMWETILAGQMWRGEVWNRRKDGSTYLEGQTITPVKNEQGEISHFVSIKRDITQRRKAEETLEALYQASLQIQEPLRLQERLDRLLLAAQRVLDLDRVNILLADPEGKWLQAVASFGSTESLAEIRVPIGPDGGGLAQAYISQQAILWDGQTPLPEDYRLRPPYDRIRALRSNAFAILPLTVQGRPIGVLGADRKHTRRPLDQATLEFLQLFAAQAAVAIENARLYVAVENRAMELGALRDVGQATTSRLELSAVLEAAVIGAKQLLGAQHAQIILWNEKDQTLRYGAAMGPEAERVRSQEFTLGRGINGTVALTRRPMLLEDYQGSPYLVPECFDVVSTVTVPVLFGDRLLGVLHSHTTSPDKRFTLADLRRLQELATQVAIAIENARLYEAERRRTAELQAVMEVSRQVVGERPLPTLLQDVVARAVGLTRAHSGTLYLWDEGEGILVPTAWINLGDYMGTVRYRPGQGITGTVADTGQGLIWNDYPAHAQHDSQLLRHIPLQACMAAPLKSRSGLLGVLTLSHTVAGQKFTWEDFHLLETFASQMAIAIENAQLYERIRQHAAALEKRVQERTHELEAANRQLAAASQHKSEFLANMSHELRTPLNSVIGFSELLLEQTKDLLPSRQARFLTHIHNSGKHLLQLINDILDLSKVEAGKLSLRPEPIPVAQTLEDILVIARGLAHQKGQAVQPDFETDLPFLSADPVRFKQILFNLLSNAVKFTPVGGLISVTARQVSGDAEMGRRGETETQGSGEVSAPRLRLSASPPVEESSFLQISVKDSGAGIRAEDMPRLFREFVQLETTQAQRHEGTGLGLALTKRLVEAHGGRIWAESEGEGKGSTFTVVLPYDGSHGESA